MPDPFGRRRVAIILPSFGGGGAERVLLTFAKELDPARFAAEVVVIDGTGPWRSFVPDRIPVTDLQRKRIRAGLLPLAGALHRSRADVAVSTIGALNLALLALKPFLPAGLKVVVREANTPHRHAQSEVGRRLYRMAYRWLYRRAARVISPASFLIRELVEEFGVARDKITIIHNPVDVAALEAAAKMPVRAPGAGPRFVAVGRLTRQKGFDRLLEMMAADPSDAQLTILGDGPDRASLEAQRDELGLANHVALPGFSAEAPRFVAGADALLLPSRWEGLPNVVLEALALGTPVVATPESGGIGEIAALAPPGSITIAAAGRDFVAAMRQVQGLPDRERRSLLPETFRLTVAAERFERLIARV
jgi:glycosyltransferase involved in cell wall biosynthesis